MSDEQPTTSSSTIATAHFVNPSSNTARNFEKSISYIEKPSGVKTENRMSYSPNEIPSLSRHLSESNIPSQPKQNYEDLVSCPVCFDVFDSENVTKLPKILPCQHTYCVECIKNLMHCSTDGAINCPQCKYKIESLKDAMDLPTSRIVLTLLEKESLNYQGYASCPGCRQIRSLEVCFECNLPLCVQCISKHYESWKNDITQNCLLAEKNLEGYKCKIDLVNSHIVQNFENVQQVKEEIENAFNLLFQRLNTEKDILLKSINQIKEENSKYVNFKKDVTSLIASFKVFRESNETFDKKLMIPRMKKCKNNFEQVGKIEKEYQDLTSSNFKVLERFETRPLPDLNFYFSGNLIIDELELDRNVVPMSQLIQQHQDQQINQYHQPILNSRPKSQAPSVPPTQPSAPIPKIASKSKITIPKLEPLRENLTHAGSSSSEFNREVARNKNFGPVNPLAMVKSDSLEKWFLKSQIKPQSEITIPLQPAFMASYENLLFCMDSSSFLYIYEKEFSAELKPKNSVKMNIPNVKSISVNGSYLAVAYSGLKKEQLKGIFKQMNPSGVILFRREQHVVCTVHEKLMEIKNDAAKFKSLSGCALSEKYLYVCDKELRTLYQFDIKSTVLVNSTIMPEAEPTSVSINNDYVLVTDKTNSTIYVYDAESLAKISVVNKDEINLHTGTFNSLITNENIIFLNNSENQIALLDSNFELRGIFNEIQAKILSLAILRDQNQMLVIGSVNSKSQFKLFGYTI